MIRAVRWALLPAFACALATASPAGAATAEQVRALAEVGIHLGEAESPLVWTDTLVQELLAGLQALPEKARRSPGPPLELVLRARPSPWGMGDGSDAAPEWEDGFSRFILYAWEEAEEPRVTFRLERLDRAQREALWRRRAIVHAVVRRWDAAHEWSDRSRWKDLTGWSWFGTAVNPYAWAYSRARGQASAALDLATFAEEALVPAEQFVPDAVSPDDRLECQEFSKLRFLRERLGIPPSSPVGGCPAFERWAALDRLSHLELLFSAPSGQRPQSLFGHLMLRPVHAAGPHGTGPGYEPVVEVAALTGTGVPPLGYLWRGLTGGFLNIFGSSTLATVIREHVEHDQRTLRRFRLQLSEEERVRVMERTWELERRGYFPYRFLSDNCAAYVIFLLNGALEEARRIRTPPLLVIPGATLDAIADLEGLLSHEPLDFESHRNLAVEAERARDALIDALPSSLDPALLRGWEAFGREAKSREHLEREQAYERLGALVSQTLSRDRGLAASLYAVIAATQKVERFLADEAVKRKKQIIEATRMIPEGTRLPTAEELIAVRQLQSQRERPEVRRLEDLRRFVELVELMESLPRRPFTAEEAEAVEQADAIRRTYLQFSRIHGDLLEKAFPGVDPEAFARDEQARRTEEVRALDRSSIESSGWLRSAIGLGVSGSPGAMLRPTAVLRSALWSERVGERRLHGFDPQLELRLLDTEAQWTWEENRPRLAALEMDVVRVRSLLRNPMAARDPLWGHLGWGAGFRFSRVQGREAPERYSAHGSLYAPLRSANDFRSFTLLGVGAALDLEADLLPVGAGGGPTVELVHRAGLPGDFANAILVEATYAPRVGVLGARRLQLEHRASAVATLMFQVGGPRGVLLGPRVGMTWERDPAGESTTRIVAALMGEWL